MKYIILYFCFLSSCSSIQKVNNNDCLEAWKNEFESYVLMNKPLFKSTGDRQTCISDTLAGIKILSRRVFYGTKSNYKLAYRPSYLYFSTHVLSIDSLTSRPEVSHRSNGAVNLPVEMVKIYFIQSLFEGSFTFKNKVLLGYKLGDVQVNPLDMSINRKIIKEAERSMLKWVDLVEEKGLDYVRSNRIDPLYFSSLEWK